MLRSGRLLSAGRGLATPPVGQLVGCPTGTQPGTAACTETGIRPNPIAWGPVTHGDVGRPCCIDDEEQRFQTTQMAKVVHRTRLDRHPEATSPNCGGRTTASSATRGRGRETTSKRRPNERSEAGAVAQAQPAQQSTSASRRSATQQAASTNTTRNGSQQDLDLQMSA